MKSITTSLSAIATIAIAGYLLTSFEVISQWWSLPLIAIVTGLFTIILPALCSRINVFFSYISAGIAILFLTTTDIIRENVVLCTTTLFVIAIFTEAIVHKFKGFHFGELIFDFGISLFTAYIFRDLTEPLVELFILILTYIMLIVFDFRVSLSYRKKNDITKVDESYSENDTYNDLD